MPTANRGLAERIIEQGGALVSEYPPGTRPQKQFFIARNRLMSGLADAVLITEAIEKSGALHTARFAIEQGRDILAVPGSIYSHASVGTNNLIKTLRAASVTSYKDVLECLGLNEHSVHAREVKGRNRNEQVILDLILQGSSEANDILDNSGLDVREFNTALTMLEIGGKIRALGANHWSLS